MPTITLTARELAVTAIATDKYRLGFQRVTPAEPPEAGFAAAIPLGVLARVRSIFKTTKRVDPIIKPWLIRVGDDFIGIIVPVRYRTPADDDDAWLSLLDEPTAAAVTS